MTINEQHLLDYFADKLSAQESVYVQTWIDASEDNKKLARDVQYICLATNALQAMERADTTKALLLVKKRIRRKRFLQNFNWMHNVAALFIGILISSALYILSSDEQMPIEYVEMRTNPGVVTKVQLPDGSTVWLNSRSYLKYPQQFTEDSRFVTLEGEAYFSIQKNQDQKFIVKTPFDASVEVLGTEFNMEVSLEDREVSTALVSGSVSFSYETSGNKRIDMLMKPNEAVSYNANSKEIEKSRPYLPTLTAWKDGLVVLRNTSFKDALSILSKHFDVEFIVSNSKYYKYAFTGTFDNQRVDMVLEHFKYSSGIRYRDITKKTIDSTPPERKTIELY